MRRAKRHPPARSVVRHPKLPLFLRQHLRLGDEHRAQMEERDGHHQRENGHRHTERRPDLHQDGEVFLHQLRGQGQGLPDAVQGVAKRAHGQADEPAGNVAVGTFSLLSFSVNRRE